MRRSNQSIEFVLEMAATVLTNGMFEWFPFFPLFSLLSIRLACLDKKKQKTKTKQGCVRVVHYTADAMGFHPTVTYEGDCQQSGSINPSAAEVKSDDSAILKDVSAPINPSSALLSRPVHSAVPGLINPLFETDAHDSTFQEAFLPRPSQTSTDDSSAPVDAPEEKFIVPLVASISKMPANIATLWQNIGKPFRQETAAVVATGVVNSESSNAKSDAETHESHETSPEKIHEPNSNDPVDEVVPVLVQTSDKIAETPAAAEENAVPEIVPTSSVVATENTVPETILTLLESFNPDKKEEEVDPLQVEASEVRVSRNEPDSSVPSVIESVKEESPVQAVAVESESRTSEAETSPSQSGEPKENLDEEIERSNFSGFAQSALDTVKNVTAPLTQLVQNLQNLTKPVTDLFNGLKKPASLGVVPTTGLPVVPVEAPVTSESPLGKIPATDGEAEQIPAERIVTDHHDLDDQQPSSDGTDPDIPAVPESHQTLDSASSLAEHVMSKEESGIGGSVVVESVPIVQNLESISVEINDPTAAEVVVVEPSAVAAEEETAEPPVKVEHDDQHIPSSVIETVVSAADPVPAEPSFQSNPTGLESSVELSQPVEQVDVHETSSFVLPIEADKTELAVEDTPTAAQSAQYANIVAPVIYSAPLEAGSFVVHQPDNTHRADYSRSVAMPYGMRVHAFIPNYAAPAIVYSQQPRRRSHHLPTARFAPAAPTANNKQQRNDYGTRYTTAVRTNPPPTNSHYAVRPAAPKHATWSPFYSTYVY